MIEDAKNECEQWIKKLTRLTIDWDEKRHQATVTHLKAYSDKPNRD